jgi:hypothetical protein
MSASPVYRQRQREEQALGLTHELCEIILAHVAQHVLGMPRSY